MTPPDPGAPARNAADDAVIHIIAEIVVTPEMADDARAMLVPFVEKSRTEPGCTSYALLETLTAPGRFFTVEVWASQTALDAHMETPHIRELMPKLTPLLAKPLSVAATRAVSL